MGYRIAKYKGDRWALLYRHDRGIKNGKAQVESRIIYPGDAEYRDLGLKPDMTLEQAKQVINSVRAEKKLQRRDRQRHAISMRIKTDNQIAEAYFPENILEEFEKQIIPRQQLSPSHWRAARRYIMKVSLHPSKWYEEADRFYLLFEKDKRSPDYSRRILRVLNEYGWLYCLRLSQPWREISVFRGKWHKRIVRAYRDKLSAKKRHFDCVRLNPSLLEGKQSEFSLAQYRWLFVSLWFGLRPREIDEIISTPQRHEISKNEKHDFWMLTIRQSKVGEKPKHIPALYPEQEKALEYIRSRDLDRPLIKTVRRVLQDAGLTLYSGRKGFVNLMHDKGHTVAEISAWLGHENMDTTRRFYWDIQEVVFEKRRA